MKIYAENLMQNIEDLERELNNNNKKLSEFEKMNQENINYKKILKSQDEKNLKISELEKKLNFLNSQGEKDLKNLEKTYLEKIKSLNKKIISLEEKEKESHFKKISLKNNTNYTNYEEKFNSEKNKTSVGDCFF